MVQPVMYQIQIDPMTPHLDEYNRIIDFRKQHPLSLSEYGEFHHVKPKSLYPALAKDPDNIVRLTASEHFLCHYHLWKHYKEELKDTKKSRSMAYAFFNMKRTVLKSNELNILATLYESSRKQLAQLSALKTGNKRAYKSKSKTVSKMKSKVLSKPTLK